MVFVHSQVENLDSVRGGCDDDDDDVDEDRETTEIRNAAHLRMAIKKEKLDVLPRVCLCVWVCVCV